MRYPAWLMPIELSLANGDPPMEAVLDVLCILIPCPGSDVPGEVFTPERNGRFRSTSPSTAAVG